MSQDKKRLIKKAIIPVFILIIMGVALWFHYEAFIHNIFIDYGIEPFDASGCRQKGFLGLPLTTYGE